MYHYSRVEYDSGENIQLLDIMHGVGQMKMWQASLGAGYAYNWVPGKHWLVSVMLLPMITFYNRGKVFYYEYDNPEDPSNQEVHYVDSELTKNKVVPNFDTRLSITYNRAHYYFNAYGTYNSFRYDNNAGIISAWRCSSLEESTVVWWSTSLHDWDCILIVFISRLVLRRKRSGTVLLRRISRWRRLWLISMVADLR